MEIKMFYYLKEKNAKPLQTDVLVIPFGSNARSLAILAPTSEWVRDNNIEGSLNIVFIEVALIFSHSFRVRPWKRNLYPIAL